MAERIDGGIPVGKVREAISHISGAPRSLEQTVAPGDGDGRTLADTVRDERSDADTLVVNKLLRDDVQASLLKLLKTRAKTFFRDDVPAMMAR